MGDNDIVVCALCSEVDAKEKCGGGHSICAICARLCRQMTIKLVGEVAVDTPIACPMDGCEAFLVESEHPVYRPRRFARLVRLQPTSANYIEVENAFGRSVRTAPGQSPIVAIFRIENTALACIYEACRARFEKEGRVVATRSVGANEKRVFHGTTRTAAGAIIREGFDTSRSGSVHGQALGPGSTPPRTRSSASATVPQTRRAPAACSGAALCSATTPDETRCRSIRCT